MALQKQKTPDRGDEDKGEKSKMQDDPTLKSAADRAREALAKADQAATKKRGYWTSCCGVRYWVEED